MLNEFMKLGQVVEVRGQKIRVRVFENKNGPILLYQGNIIKNVSVGSFIKIPKGYISIIGKIEGEHISELKEKNAAERFQKESDSIERMIDVSVLGVMEKGIFVKGVMEIPLVFSDAYILEEYELQRVFSFFDNEKNAITLGNIAEYKNYKLHVDAQLLFASHIGIFGNTGSGKSNTLAAIYSALFQKFGEKKNFHKSNFLFFDFNGEYENAFTGNKQVHRLSTRNEDGDKIEIPYSFLSDIHFWSILCEASGAIQQPFLERVLVFYRKLVDSVKKGKESLISFLQKSIRELLLICYREGGHTDNRNDLEELFELLLENTEGFSEMDALTRRLHRNETTDGFQKQEFQEKQFFSFVIRPALDMISYDNVKEENGFDYFIFALKYREILETTKHFIQEGSLKTLIRRFEMNMPYLQRVFCPIEKTKKTSNIQVFSLMNVTGELKRLIPAALCCVYYERQKRLRHGSLHIIIDEAHDILNNHSDIEETEWKNCGLQLFEELVKEGRKFGTFLTISSQRPSDISEAILSQMHNYFIHRIVNKNDIHAIGRAVVFLDEASFGMVPVLPQGSCIFAGAASNFPVMVQMDMADKQYMLSSDTIDLMKFWNGEE